MEAFLNNFAQGAFGRNRSDTMRANKCVTCGGGAFLFRDDLSLKEYRISGMCQRCQDSVFSPKEE